MLRQSRSGTRPIVSMGTKYGVSGEQAQKVSVLEYGSPNILLAYARYIVLRESAEREVFEPDAGATPLGCITCGSKYTGEYRSCPGPD